MTGHNVSLYLDDPTTWDKFKNACHAQGTKPNTVIRSFIQNYSDEVLGLDNSLEKRIALSLIEAQQIESGKIKGRRARDLVNEI